MIVLIKAGGGGSVLDAVARVCGRWEAHHTRARARVQVERKNADQKVRKRAECHPQVLSQSYIYVDSLGSVYNIKHDLVDSRSKTTPSSRREQQNRVEQDRVRLNYVRRAPTPPEPNRQ